MYSRIFALILAVGIGAGIGVTAVSLMETDGSTANNAQRPAVRVAAEQLVQRTSGEFDPEQLSQIVESLAQILDEEISERRALEQQLEETRTEVAELRQFLGGPSDIEVAQRAEAQVDRSIEDRLAAAGFTPQQLETIRQYEGQALMRQVELDDQARREGWVNTPRYNQEMYELFGSSNTIHQHLGDDGYDRYLFANGRPNRITIGTVIPTSPAEQAGLQVGDVIKTYGGEQVFSSQQLTELRSAGKSGSTVTVEIIRDGQPMQITMPRGPMGIQTGGQIVDPTE
jgi:hypothetical protein